MNLYVSKDYTSKVHEKQLSDVCVCVCVCGGGGGGAVSAKRKAHEGSDV